MVLQILSSTYDCDNVVDDTTTNDGRHMHAKQWTKFLLSSLLCRTLIRFLYPRRPACPLCIPRLNPHRIVAHRHRLALANDSIAPCKSSFYRWIMNFIRTQVAIHCGSITHSPLLYFAPRYPLLPLPLSSLSTTLRWLQNGSIVQLHVRELVLRWINNENGRVRAVEGKLFVSFLRISKKTIKNLGSSVHCVNRHSVQVLMLIKRFSGIKKKVDKEQRKVSKAKLEFIQICVHKFRSKA